MRAEQTPAPFIVAGIERDGKAHYAAFEVATHKHGLLHSSASLASTVVDVLNARRPSRKTLARAGF